MTWEYQILIVKLDSDGMWRTTLAKDRTTIWDAANRLGKDGWELVSAVPITTWNGGGLPDNEHPVSHFVYMKRPIAS